MSMYGQHADVLKFDLIIL